MMSSESTDLTEQDGIHGKQLPGLTISSWGGLGESKFGLSTGTKEDIWKQTEVSNVWSVLPVAGNAWGRSDDYSSMFQGISGDNKGENLKSFGSSTGWDSAGVGEQLKSNTFGMPGSSDMWRGFQEYDPFKRSWGEVDFTVVTSSDKNSWGPDNKDSSADKMQDIQQLKSSGQPVQKSASMSEISTTLQSGTDAQPTTTSDGSSFSSNLPLKSVSSGNFFTDPLTKPDSERSQPDGAEVSQQNKEDMIAKMVNCHDGWGKKPIRQDTPWQTDAATAAQSQQGLPDANTLMPAGSVIGSDVPKMDLGNVWTVPDPLSGGGGQTNSWNSSFFNPSASSFSGSTLDWAPDNDIGLWSGPPPPGCEMANPNLWTGPPKDGTTMGQPTLWSSNSSTPGWSNDIGVERHLWGNDSGLANFWPPKTPDEFAVHKKVGPLSGGQTGCSFFGGPSMKPIGMWGDAGSVQTETGYWNQSNQMTKEDLRQVLSSGNITAEKLLSMINSNGRPLKDPIEQPRGRMLRGKSVIETSTDYNQSFPGLQRGVGGGYSAFQPPQQLYNQQLQQQLLLQKAGLVGGIGTGFQHGRSASHIPKMDSLSGAIGGGLGLNQPLGGGSAKNQNLLQSFLQLQSVLQPLLVERSQLQQNKAISLTQKKNRLDVLNHDIAKIKTCIDQLHLSSGGAPTPQPIGSSFNQSDIAFLDETRLRQALNQLKVDPYSSSTSPLGSFLGLANAGNNAAIDLATLLQNVNISGNPNPVNSWLPNVLSNLPSGDAGSFIHGQSGHQDAWSSYLGKPSGFSGVPPPPPGLGPSDKIGGGSSFMGQQGLFSRSTSWAPGEKVKSGSSGVSTTNWLLVKNTSAIESHILHSLCSQCGTLQQLLSNKLTGHSLACFKDDSLTVQAKLQQVGSLASDCLSSQDVLNLLDASGSGGVGSAWVNVSASATVTPSTPASSTVASAMGSASNCTSGSTASGTTE